MRRKVIADTTCFIVLSEIKELDILRALYAEVYTSETIAQEFGEPLPSWVVVSVPKDVQQLEALSRLVDKGEASAISLALETSNSLVILDDQKGRSLARSYGLAITGTLGVLMSAKRLGIVPFLSPLLEKIQVTNFHVSDDLIEEVRRLSGE